MHGSTLTDERLGVDTPARRRSPGAPDSKPRFGDVLANRYELHAELGRGGMGRVLRAHDRLLGRDVALKVLTTSEDDDTARQACLREARVAARVSHPNVAAVLDIGADHDLGVTFLVMELVLGRTLREVRGAAGTLAPSDAVQLVAQVAGALEATHARGVVHGDVTPRNVIVRPDGVAKLVDFGIARVLDANRPIEVRGRYGSIPYLAPEQVHGAPPDARSDVYALGAVLYELLVGEPPYTGRDTATVMAARLVADPPPPSGRNPAVSPALERVVLTALARDPKRRYASAGELREALCGVLSAATSDTRVLSRPAPIERLVWGAPSTAGGVHLAPSTAAASGQSGA
ncbi:MAG: serine/threonine protein kinase, partial [Chloroflexota bacterium]|nr:serine/threonine protein kinase [Chloroflexota bacterium]